MAQEIRIDGIGISQDVIAAIVSRAAEGVEGVASVGVKGLATNLVTMLSTGSITQAPAVEAEVVDDALKITLRIVVFFGYPFKKLAATFRSVVAQAIDAQIGVDVASIDVCIDGLVFPKE